ncbi:initiation factor 2 subunit family-domain-containing protein [Lipomyces tetrasporus]|uniref:Translation initiation factor eIF2B subunit delta n=1 Tax=Lipomyces tetrasporus TaxID=54092 RepID=A0AAD7QMS7_9ASCO|nr:initiation factor 2 subunit family-domain-containing protein [Lipomyces tetrasporus]KAJ8097938.1 initiation factor 2 subunit family-domain-containing protein [Lipomyces tetrasporus]
MPEASAKPAGTQTTKAQQQKGKDKNSAGAQENKAQRKARRAAKVSELGKSSNTPQEAITQARAQSQAKQCRAASGTSNASNVGGGSSNSLVNATVSNAISSLTAQSTAIHGSDILDKRVGLFKHLEITRRSGTADAAKDIHPVILALTLQFASYTVIGSSARCRATLRAFQKVIKDYRTPVGTTLSRNLTNHLSRQIDFLITARPLSITMGNAIRWLKQEISVVSIDVSDDQARESLIEKIETYIRDKIEVADRVIVQSAVKHIGNGDVILAFSRSAVVEQVFLEANLRGIEFSVVVVDTRPFYEGKEMVRRLARAGLKCEYVLISGLSYVLNDTTSVFLGAHAVLSNGQLYSRVGTALVAMSAKRKNVPVIVCCESIKFSNRVQLDSVTFNELGSPDELMNISIDPTPKPGPLKNWRDLPNLKLLNILYDLTPPEYIKKIVTEVGSLPPSSVPVIIREYNSA